MSRRALGGGLLAAGLISCGLVPFLGTANAAACPAWTDSPTDASFNQMALPSTGNDGLEIVSAGVSSNGSDTVASIGMKKLAAGYAGGGDEISMQATINGQNILIYADRLPSGNSAGVINNSNSSAPLGAATATWDTAKSVVTITVKQAELDAAVASATAGKPATNLAAASSLLAAFIPLVPYDQAIPPADTVYTVGKACAGGGGGGGTPTPTGSPTPTPTATAPAPSGDCADFADGKGDAPASSAAAAASANDADLDIVGYTLQTTADKLISYIKVDKLATKPALAPGHTFYSEFTFNKHAFSIFAAAYDPAAVGQARNTGSTTGVLAPTAQLRVDASYKSDVVVDAVFDTAKSTVRLSVPRAALDKYAAAPFADGGELTLVKARSNADFGGVTPAGGDTTGPADAKLVIGSNKCFPPPPAKLALAGATKVQFSDAAAVSAKLTDADGAALKGKTVTFLVGPNKSVAATTGADGVARASVDPGVPAGTYTVAAGFAGDSVAGKASDTTALTVTTEATKVALSATKSGSKRNVTAKLADDDGKLLGGQTVNWYVNGKKVGSGKTSAAGAVTYVAKAGQTVVAEFLAVSGRYAAGKATLKV
jgi:hypothetical protein